MELTLSIRRDDRTFFVELFPEDGTRPYTTLKGRDLEDIMRELGRSHVWMLLANKIERAA